MSILRFSAIKHAVYVPWSDGQLARNAYSPQHGAGCIGSSRTAARPALRRAVRSHLEAMLPAATRDLPPEQPVAIFVHGYGFDPNDPVTDEPHQTANPHGRSYHDRRLPLRREKEGRCTGWNLGLGIDVDDSGQNGLAIGLGWYSDPNYFESMLQYGRSHYLEGLRYAERAAALWADLVTVLADLMPGREIDTVAHCGGAWVAMRGLTDLAAHRPETLGRVGRVLLLGGTATTPEARQVLRAAARGSGDDGDGPAFYNLVSRHDNVLEWLSHFASENGKPARLVGYDGLSGRRRDPRWLDLQLDRAPLQTWVHDTVGLFVSGSHPPGTWDHWNYVTVRNNIELCRRILHRRPGTGIAELRAGGIPEGVAGRRARWRYRGSDSWDPRTRWAWERLR